MTEFRPLSPKQALELAEAADVADAERLIRDFAAAGLVKSYAAKVDTVEPGAGKKTVRDAALPPELWERMIEEGQDADVWAGGTVRLLGAERVGGKAAVKITAIGFNPGDLSRMIDRHLGRLANRSGKAKQKQTVPGAVEVKVKVSPPEGPTPSPSGLAVIPEGAVTVTINQATAALGLKRTTVSKLCNEGRLDRRKIGSRALITT